jgi:hypothetical protein
MIVLYIDLKTNMQSYRSSERPKHAYEKMSNDWQNQLYNGLVQNTGKPAPVFSGNINKPNIPAQKSEMMVPDAQIVSNNSRYRNLQKNSQSKQRFSAHRRMQFLDQE